MSGVATVSAPVRPGLVRDVLLRDGSTLRLQAPTPADFADVKAFYDGLSPESRYFRFHGYARADLAARTDAEAPRTGLSGARSGPSGTGAQRMTQVSPRCCL